MYAIVGIAAKPLLKSKSKSILCESTFPVAGLLEVITNLYSLEPEVFSEITNPVPTPVGPCNVFSAPTVISRSEALTNVFCPISKLAVTP